MEKKTYLVPSMTEIEMETVSFIAASNTTPTMSGSYNVKDWDDEDSSDDF